MKEKDDKNSVKERTMILETIAKEAKRNFEKLKEGIGMLKPNNGGMNEKQIWKLKKKLCPRSRDLPTAMIDGKGNLLISNKAIE